MLQIIQSLLIGLSLMALLPLTGASESCTVNTHTPAPALTLTEADHTSLPLYYSLVI